MADTQPTFTHPVFQPRADKNEIAVVHLLWVIAGKVFVKPSGCWFWGGSRAHNGYGTMSICGHIHRVHRIVYEYTVGPIPEGMLVLHHCDNPPCCRPDHLYVGTHQDNILDCVTRARHPASLLDENMVREIRLLSAPPKGRRRKELAERFGVSIWTIKDILSGRTWSHVE